MQYCTYLVPSLAHLVTVKLSCLLQRDRNSYQFFIMIEYEIRSTAVIGDDESMTLKQL